MPVKGIRNFQQRAESLKKALARPVPVKIQAAAVRQFRANFKAQGFINNGVKPWRPRIAYKTMHLGKKADRLTLVDRALLINSVRPLGQASWGRIAIQAGGPHVPYAQIHNEGGTIRGTFRVRAHTRRTSRGKMVNVKSFSRRVNTTIPKRQFMGDSHELRMEARKIIMQAVVDSLAK